MTEIRRLFKNTNFIAIMTSQILSQLTFNILGFLILIRLFELTQSTIATSFLWIAYALPAIIVGPVAAASVDLVDKRKMLMITNFLQTVFIVVYALFMYHKLVFFSYAVVFLYSFVNQFYVPAEAAALPLFVSKEDLPGANSIFLITQQSSLVIGFGIAGVLNDILGFRPTLFLVSVFLFVAFVAVSFLPERKSQDKLTKTLEKGLSDFFEEILEGYKFIKNTQKVLIPFILLLGLQVVASVLVVNLPRVATDILRVRPTLSGFLIIMPAGIGAIAGTIFVTKVLAKKIRKKRVIFVSLIGFITSLLVISIVLPLISYSLLRIILGIVFFALVGLGFVGSLVPSVTFLQESTPKDLLGRVFGNFWFLTSIVTVLPVIFSATISDILGINALLFLIAIFFGSALVFYEKFYTSYWS